MRQQFWWNVSESTLSISDSSFDSGTDIKGCICRGSTAVSLQLPLSLSGNWFDFQFDFLSYCQVIIGKKSQCHLCIEGDIVGCMMLEQLKAYIKRPMFYLCNCLSDGQIRDFWGIFYFKTFKNPSKHTDVNVEKVFTLNLPQCKIFI